MLLSVLLLATSCLNTDDDNYTYYNDTAITAFTLGTLNRYYIGKTKYTNEDSVYKTTITGSKYKMYIDQAENRIFNNDSLPKGTDAKHVLCTVSSLNSGIVIIKYTSQSQEDSLAYYSSSDSVDFSTDREFRVYANDGSAYRKYTVKVNVHKEDPDSFSWHKIATVNDFKSLDGLKLVSLSSKMIAFCAKDGKTTVRTTDSSDGVNWTEGKTFDDANVAKNTAVLDGTLYIVSNGKLKNSVDGATWTDVNDFDKTQLLGAGSKNLYALGEDGIYSSADKGLSWTAEEMGGSDKSELPSEAVSFAMLESNVYDNTENLIMTGLLGSATETADTAAVVWGKTLENVTGAEAQPWVRYESDSGYKLPALTNVAMTRYGNVLVALGGAPLGGAITKGFTYLYMSRDKGLTWQTDSRYVLPSDPAAGTEFSNGTSNVFGMSAGEDVNYSERKSKGDEPVVKDNMLWIISGGTGEVWRGRLNELGWRKYESSFTE